MSSEKNRDGGRREEERRDKRGGAIGSNGESGGGAGADRGVSTSTSSRGGGSKSVVSRDAQPPASEHMRETTQSPDPGELDRSIMRLDNNPDSYYVPLGSIRDMSAVVISNAVTVVSERGHSLSPEQLYNQVLSVIVPKDGFEMMQSITPVGSGRWLIKFKANFVVADKIKQGELTASNGEKFAIFVGDAQFGMQHTTFVYKTIRVIGLVPALKIDDIAKHLIIEPAKIKGLQLVESGMEMIRSPAIMRNVGNGTYRFRVKCPVSQLQTLISRVIGLKRYLNTNVTISMVGLAPKCFGCGEPHLIRDCPRKNLSCSKCGKRGHTEVECNAARATANDVYGRDVRPEMGRIGGDEGTIQAGKAQTTNGNEVNQEVERVEEGASNATQAVEVKQAKMSEIVEEENEGGREDEPENEISEQSERSHEEGGESEVEDNGEDDEGTMEVNDTVQDEIDPSQVETIQPHKTPTSKRVRSSAESTLSTPTLSESQDKEKQKAENKRLRNESQVMRERDNPRKMD